MVQWVKRFLRIPGNHGSEPEQPPKAEQVYWLLKQGLWPGAGQRQGDPWRFRFCRNSVKTKVGRYLMSTSGLHVCTYSLMCRHMCTYSLLCILTCTYSLMYIHMCTYSLMFIHVYTLTHTHTKLKEFLRK